MSRHKDARPPRDHARRILNTETTFSEAAYEMIAALHAAGWPPNAAVKHVTELLQSAMQRFAATHGNPPRGDG